MTDEDLMLDVSKDNLQSASILYDRYSKRLYNYFVKISFDRDNSYDLMQNTFLRMIRYRNTYKEGKSFEAWIFQIGRNAFADHLKKDRLLVDDHQDVYQMHAPDSDEGSESIQNEKMLYMAMAKLPEESREILVLSRFQGMKYEQIAQVLGLTVAGVKVKVHRAIKKLKQYYLEIEKI
jgi:RNA polymerase sigma-70 factor (ECF subfamily)